MPGATTRPRSVSRPSMLLKNQLIVGLSQSAAPVRPSRVRQEIAKKTLTKESVFFIVIFMKKILSVFVGLSCLVAMTVGASAIPPGGGGGGDPPGNGGNCWDFRQRLEYCFCYSGQATGVKTCVSRPNIISGGTYCDVGGTCPEPSDAQFHMP